MSNLTTEKIEGYLIIKLNRPKVFNSFNTKLAKQLQDELDKANNDDTVRAVLLTGSGKAFSTGQDIAELMDPDGPELSTILSENYNPIVKKIRNLKKPIVAAVNGVAAGAGVNIALACDIVVATKSSKFIQIFSNIGLIPDAGGTHILPRLIGWQRASALMMLGEPIDATYAQEIGMIYKVFEDDEFESNSVKLVSKLSKMPTLALSRIKQALNSSFTNNFEQQLQVEEDLQIASAKTSDFKEGISSFIEKRLAKFEGK